MSQTEVGDDEDFSTEFFTENHRNSQKHRNGKLTYQWEEQLVPPPSQTSDLRSGKGVVVPKVFRNELMSRWTRGRLPWEFGVVTVQTGIGQRTKLVTKVFARAS